MKDKPLNETSPERALPSAEMEEIMGQVPPRVLRYGIAVILGMMLFLAGMAWFIRYPDQVRGRVEVSTEQPPLPLTSRVSARISLLKVADSALVDSGDVLLVLGQHAGLDRVEAWKVSLTRLVKNTVADSLWKLSQMGGPGNPGVEALSGAAAGAEAAWKAYRSLLEQVTRYDQARAASLGRRIEEQEELIRTLRGRLQLMREEGRLIRRDYRRDSLLALEGGLSPAELEAGQARVLRHAMDVEDMRTRIAEVVIRKGEYGEEMNEFLASREEGMQAALRGLAEHSARALEALSAWEREYVLRSPAHGRVSFSRDWVSGQEVGVGEVLLHVLPGGRERLLARLRLPVRGSGLVAPGARVRIRLDDFPAMEYGTLEAVIIRVNAIPEEQQLLAEARLTNGLTTSYQQVLPFRGVLHGEAEVVTRTARLLERILRPLRYLLEQRTGDMPASTSPSP
ncbi:MAG TPA: HlyD family efflux transporter periplasmic adaptor subunit [Bacteroidales bacterium]|nr:HlyD family efflux transporter periplasmic adaptor subunit [Bacteroidales bacterium]